MVQYQTSNTNLSINKYLCLAAYYAHGQDKKNIERLKNSSSHSFTLMCMELYDTPKYSWPLLILGYQISKKDLNLQPPCHT